MEESPPPMDEARKQTMLFAQLIEILAQNAVMLLGVPDRSGRQRPPDLNGAEMMIEMLSVLQKKTKGNLTKEEDRMITGTLFQLQSAFAEVASKSGEFEKARKATEANEASESAGTDPFEEDLDAPPPAAPPQAQQPVSSNPQPKPQGIQSSAAPQSAERKVKFTKKYE